MIRLLSTAYLPQVSYIRECLSPEEIRIEAFETYGKQSYRNRCAIAGPNGRQILIVPVNKPGGHHTPVRDILIDYGIHWQRMHWRSICAAYNKSPFFLHYQDYFIPFFEKQVTYLLDLNLEILETILNILRIDKKITLTGQYEIIPSDALDRRGEPVSKRHLQPNEPYTQVFSARYPFISDLSVIDLLFNIGPESADYLASR
jgi:hypothetical protein